MIYCNHIYYQILFIVLMFRFSGIKCLSLYHICQYLLGISLNLVLIVLRNQFSVLIVFLFIITHLIGFICLLLSLSLMSSSFLVFIMFVSLGEIYRFSSGSQESFLFSSLSYRCFGLWGRSYY